MKCYLESEYRVNHQNIEEKYRNKFVVVGKLFKGNYICSWCYLKLVDGTSLELTNNDTIAKNQWRQRFPQYAILIDTLGEDKVKFELSKQILEIPTDPESGKASYDHKELFNDLKGSAGTVGKIPMKINVE